MQTFLCEPMHPTTASVLDGKRLVKQLLEGRQILQALAGETKGWVNHPATLMWKNHEQAFGVYLECIASEMEKRNYKWQNNWEVIENLLTNKFKEKFRKDIPSWMIDNRYRKIITTHRANLYLKAPELYPQYEYAVQNYREMVCCERCNYYWPSHYIERNAK